MVLNILKKHKKLIMLNDNPSYHDSHSPKSKRKKWDPFEAAEELTSNLLNNSFNNYKEHI